MQAPKTSKPIPCPLPIQTTQLARGLLRLHCRLRGEVRKAADDEELMVDAETARQVMLHVEALVDFLGVRFEPKALKPIRSRPKNGPLAFGDLRVEILAVLRANGDWMSYPEIAETIIAKHRLSLEPARRSHFLQKLREATHALSGQKAVERESPLKLGNTSVLQRWRLSRHLFRTKG